MDTRQCLEELDRPRGRLTRWLRVGGESIAIDGLDAALAGLLAQRWGPLLAERPDVEARYRLHVHRWDGPRWLEPRGVETYRVEALGGPGRPVVLSYNFALCVESDRVWKVAVREGDDEPVGRVLENATRQAVARVALDAGGFAMHGAGLLREGRAWVFAGPSNAGKTTAIALSAPAASLGDDLALVVPRGDGWAAPALPFDNSESVRESPGPGPYPLAGVLRLVQAGAHRIERETPGRAIASLMGCVAFPWSMPEASADLLTSVSALAEAGLFARLHFSRDPGFWDLLDRSFASGPDGS